MPRRTAAPRHVGTGAQAHNRPWASPQKSLSATMHYSKRPLLHKCNDSAGCTCQCYYSILKKKNIIILTTPTSTIHSTHALFLHFSIALFLYCTIAARLFCWAAEMPTCRRADVPTCPRALYSTKPLRGNKLQFWLNAQPHVGTCASSRLLQNPIAAPAKDYCSSLYCDLGLSRKGESKVTAAIRL